MSGDREERARREFLRAGGGMLALSLILGSNLGHFVPARAASPGTLDVNQTRALLAMARTLFPHDMLDDGIYMAAVNGVATKMEADATNRDLVVAGLAKLDRAAGRPFVELSEQARVNVLRTMEKSDFFQLVYGETINGVYGNPAVWMQFGYEGPSAEKGGYLARGFDDIDWLPKQP